MRPLILPSRSLTKILRDKKNLHPETPKRPAATKVKERSRPIDNFAGGGRGIVSNAPEKESCAGIIWCEAGVEVEIRFDKPTESERKSVEDFFDWLLAEALRLAGETNKVDCPRADKKEP